MLVLDAAGRLGKIVVGMNKALGEVPVTVKLRTGVKDGRNNAHKLMPRLACEWNAAALTVSRHIDYTRSKKAGSLRRVTFFSIVAPRSYPSATLLPTSGLGLHQAMCPSCPSPRRRGTS